MRFRGREEESKRLLAAAVFAAAMGWLEAVLVVYLRKLMGLEGSLDMLDPATQEALLERFAVMFSRGEGGHLSPPFLFVEQTREAATIVMLAAVGYLAGRNLRQRAAYFFFTFGAWDIAYYAALWIVLRWPPSLETLDLLFLIPFPWLAQVWIPMAISLVFVGFSAHELLFGRRPGKRGR